MKGNWAKPAKLAALLKKHKSAGESTPTHPEGMDSDDPIAHFIYSWLLWESSTAQASEAMARVVAAHVDFNELRVALPFEVAAVVGKKYPRSDERFAGLKDSLHSIYLARHAVSLDHVHDLAKKDAKAFLDGLKGMQPFVSARVLSLVFGGHSVPADEQLVQVFVEHGVVTESVAPADVVAWLSTQIRAADASWALPALQAIMDAAWDDGTMTSIHRRIKAEKTAAENAAKKAALEAAKQEAARIAAEARAAAKQIADEKKAAAKLIADDKKALAVKKAAIKKVADLKKKAAAKIVAAKKAAMKKKADAKKKIAAKKAAAKKKTAVKKKAPVKKKPAKKTVQKPAKKTVRKPAKKTVRKPAKKTAKKPAKKTAKKKVKKTTKKAPAKKAAKKTKRTVNKKVKKKAAKKRTRSR